VAACNAARVAGDRKPPIARHVFRLAVFQVARHDSEQASNLLLAALMRVSRQLRKIDRHCAFSFSYSSAQLGSHNANGIEWWVAVYLDGVLVLLADDCRLF